MNGRYLRGRLCRFPRFPPFNQPFKTVRQKCPHKIKYYHENREHPSQHEKNSIYGACDDLAANCIHYKREKKGTPGPIRSNVTRFEQFAIEGGIVQARTSFSSGDENANHRREEICKKHESKLGFEDVDGEIFGWHIGLT